MFHQSNPKTRTCNRRVGTGRRTAGPIGEAGVGSTGPKQIGSPRKQLSVVPLVESKTRNKKWARRNATAHGRTAGQGATG